MIELTFVRLAWTPDGAVSHFRGGGSWGAQPHDLPHYHHLAFACGYQGDTLAYCREHELAHHLVAEAFGLPSRVLWPLAQGAEPDAWDAAAEEALALALQRFARAGQVPLIDRCDWDRLKRRFLGLAPHG